MDIQLGFSTGCLYKSGLTENWRLKHIKAADCKVVELGFIRVSDLVTGTEFLTSTDLSGFDYVSLHAPKHEYKNDDRTDKIFRLINVINRLRPLDLVVFHPDTVTDLGVLDIDDFPVALENMDNRKSFGKNAANMRSVLGHNEEFRMVLDVQHAYSNDPSGKLTSELWNNFYQRIDEVHLSGFRDNYHAPLYETRQDEIINSIVDWTKPVIIESPVKPEDLTKERDYILRVLAKNNGR